MQLKKQYYIDLISRLCDNLRNLKIERGERYNIFQNKSVGNTSLWRRDSAEILRRR